MVKKCLAIDRLINRYNLQPYILCVVTYVLDVVYYVPVTTLHLHC